MGSRENSKAKEAQDSAQRTEGDTRVLTPWRTLHSEAAFAGRFLEVHREHVTTGSGFVIPDYHVIRSPSWAAALCVTENQELVMVRQYRHGHEGFSLELPAGVIEPGEDPGLAAARELLEETGYQAETLVPFWQIRPEPARHRQTAYFSFGRRAKLVRPQALDASEDIRVELHPVAELDRIIEEMAHGLHVAALLWAERRGLLAPEDGPTE